MPLARERVFDVVCSERGLLHEHFDITMICRKRAFQSAPDVLPYPCCLVGGHFEQKFGAVDLVRVMFYT